MDASLNDPGPSHLGRSEEVIPQRRRERRGLTFNFLYVLCASAVNLLYNTASRHRAPCPAKLNRTAVGQSRP